MPNIKIIINNFFTKTKQNKKEIIIWAVITFIITFFLSHYFLEPLTSYLDEKFGPKPNILSNVAVYKYANISGYANLQNFYFLYFLDANWATLYFMNASDKDVINNYGSIISDTYFDFNKCPECSLYTFILINNGNKKADKVVIDIRSSTTPELVMGSPKMTTEKCRGNFESRGCYIVFENIDKGEEINFALSLKESSNINIISCVVNEKYICEFRFVKFFAQNIDPKKDILGMNGKRVLFPTLDNSKPNTLYYFDPSKFNETSTTWVSIPTILDTGK
jgi:hypothetical protein